MNRIQIDPYFFADATMLPDDAIIMEVGCMEPEKDITLHSKYPAGRMILVEGSPTNYATLRRRLLSYPGIEHDWLALAEKNGPVQFYEFAHEQHASTFPRHRTEGLRNTATFEVRGLTLAGLMAHFKAPRIDLLLLNCEGSEIFALEELVRCPEVRARVAQICTSPHCSHIHLYPQAAWDVLIEQLGTWYNVAVNPAIPEIPYYLLSRKP